MQLTSTMFLSVDGGTEEPVRRWAGSGSSCRRERCCLQAVPSAHWLRG